MRIDRLAGEQMAGRTTAEWLAGCVKWLLAKGLVWVGSIRSPGQARAGSANLAASAHAVQGIQPEIADEPVCWAPSE